MVKESRISNFIYQNPWVSNPNYVQINVTNADYGGIIKREAIFYGIQ